jgi:hypothetical protein
MPIGLAVYVDVPGIEYSAIGFVGGGGDFEGSIVGGDPLEDPPPQPDNATAVQSTVDLNPIRFRKNAFPMLKNPRTPACFKFDVRRRDPASGKALHKV